MSDAPFAVAAQPRSCGPASAGTGAFATLGFGAALLALFDSPAFAQADPDVQILQTAASLENLAVATYDVAFDARLHRRAIRAIPTVKAFVMTTKDQHAAHADGVQRRGQAARRQGAERPRPGAARHGEPGQADAHGPRPGRRPRASARGHRGADLRRQHRRARPTSNARKVTASIMGVEAQHVAVLRRGEALVGANADRPDQVAARRGAAARGRRQRRLPRRVLQDRRVPTRGRGRSHVRTDANDPMQISERELGAAHRRHGRHAPRAHAGDARGAPRRGPSSTGRCAPAIGRAHRATSPAGGASSSGSGAAVLGGLLLAACGDDDKASTGRAPAGRPRRRPARELTGDLAVAALAAASRTLPSARTRPASTPRRRRQLGTVPPAVVTFVTTAQKHHNEHAAAWNSVLTGAGKRSGHRCRPHGQGRRSTRPSPRSTTSPGSPGSPSTLENVAAATYLERHRDHRATRGRSRRRRRSSRSRCSTRRS